MSDGNIINLNEKKPKNSSQKKYKWFGLIGTLLFLLLSFFSSAFIVNEGEYKVVRQFGEVVKIEYEPGLKFKIPFIQSVITLPKYQMTYDVTKAEINTKDKKRMIIDNYAIWKITNPKDMISNARTVENAETKMEEYIYSVVRTELGQLNYDQIINDEKSNRKGLNETVTEQVNQLLALNKYGIIVTDVRMKRTDLPEENEASVFNRMISERESKAQEYLSLGDAEKQRIIAETDQEVKAMLAKASADAEEIRAEGEGVAAKIYNETYSQNEDFYSFYRTLASYKKTIDNQTVILLPADSPYAELIKGSIKE